MASLELWASGDAHSLEWTASIGSDLAKAIKCEIAIFGLGILAGAFRNSVSDRLFPEPNRKRLGMEQFMNN